MCDRQRSMVIVALGFATGTVLAILIFLFVLATGQTFGQRCEKMHPNGDVRKIEQCVDALAKGSSDGQ